MTDFTPADRQAETAEVACTDSSLTSPGAPSIRARRRMDRRLPEISAPALATGGLIVTFPHVEGVQARAFDFGALGLPGDVALLFADAARNHPDILVPTTHKSYWTQIRTFARFVRMTGVVRSVADLTTQLAWDYRAWLDCQTSDRTKKPLTQQTRAMALNTLRTLISTIKDLDPGRLPADIVFPAHAYPDRQPSTQPTRLNQGELKALSWCCQQEIREAVTCFRTGRQILAQKPSAEGERGRDRIVRAIARLNETGFSSEQALVADGISRKSIRRQGGLRHLRSYLTLTSDTLAPFYVALLVQLAGNVEPIRLLTRDCDDEDRVDNDVRQITWEKPRAGRAGARSQDRWFSERKTYDAPHLVKLLLSMTETLLSRVPDADRNRLFLIPRESEQAFGLITYRELQGATGRFLARADTRIESWNQQHPDRPKPALPAFNLRDLRGSAATQHYIASGGDIRRPMAVLNHADPATTDRYIRGPLARDLHARIIGSFQRNLVAHLCDPPTETAGEPRLSNGTGAAAASFAHDCRDPAVPSLPGRPGPRLCPLFQQCLDCPGLVIVLDAEHLARLLLAKDAFEAARERLHPERWKLLYADTYQRIVTDILPKFPEGLLPDARARMPLLPRLPPLE